jgi:hypothetical protein
MDEAKVGTERGGNGGGSLDPGAYIGNEPEREAETIPGGVTSRDERVAAYDSRPGLSEETTDDDSGSEGQSGGEGVVPESVEYDPLPRASDEIGTDEAAEDTPTLGGPLPD